MYVFGVCFAKNIQYEGRNLVYGDASSPCLSACELLSKTFHFLSIEAGGATRQAKLDLRSLIPPLGTTSPNSIKSISFYQKTTIQLLGNNTKIFSFTFLLVAGKSIAQKYII
jgi:hypothetical protein